MANTPLIIIQDANNEFLKLNVNGEIKEIKNQLHELKTLLLDNEMQSVQYAEKIYNIEHIDEANFGFITGRKAFNEYLTKELIEAISPICAPARRFLELASRIPNWEHRANINEKAKDIIAYSFVGVIGIQLSHLMAIGNNDFSEAKQRNYIKKCLFIARYNLDLICFVLLSKLWDNQKQKNVLIEKTSQQVIAQRFGAFEPSITDLLQLLNTIHSLYIKNNLSFPISELSGFYTHLEKDSPFRLAVEQLQKINEILDKGHYNLLDCFEAERQLTIFLKAISFLVTYNMVSIKRIGYRQLRNDNPAFLHRYTAIGIDSKANVNAEKVVYTPDTAHTDAILFFKGKNYQDSTNLFPFGIDYNALTFEQGAKICFFRSIHMEEENDSLDYIFLRTNEVINIVKKDVLKSGVNFNEVMMDIDKRTAFNLDCVVKGFEDARRALLGDLEF